MHFSLLAFWAQLGIGFLLREHPVAALATVATAVVSRFLFALKSSYYTNKWM